MSHDVRYSKGMTTSRETIIETATALNCSLTLNAPRNLHIQLASDDDTQTCVLRVTFDRIGRITEAEIDDLAAHAGYRIIRGGLGRVIGEMQLAAEKRDAAPVDTGACVECGAVHGHDETCTRVVEPDCSTDDDDEPADTSCRVDGDGLPNVRPGGDVFDELDEQYLAADGFDTRGRTAGRAIPAEQPERRERRDETVAEIDETATERFTREGDPYAPVAFTGDGAPVRPFHLPLDSTNETVLAWAWARRALPVKMPMRAEVGSLPACGAMLSDTLFCERATGHRGRCAPAHTATTPYQCGPACRGWCVFDGRPCTAVAQGR